VDVGSGSGLLSLPLSRGFTQLRLITALEIDDERRARHIELHKKLFNPLVSLESAHYDIFEPLSRPSDRDLVITNPDWTDGNVNNFVHWIVCSFSMTRKGGQFISLVPKKFFYATMAALRTITQNQSPITVSMVEMESGRSRTDHGNPAELFVFNVVNQSFNPKETLAALLAGNSEHKAFRTVQKQEYIELPNVILINT
jgi:hypothetical protein